MPAEVNLAQILCVIEERCVGRDWCVSHYGRILQIDKKHAGLSLAGRRVQLLIAKDGTLQMRYQGAMLRWCEVSTRPVHKPLRQLPATGKLPWRPGAEHPWNREARQARSATGMLASLASPPLRRLDGPGG